MYVQSNSAVQQIVRDILRFPHSFLLLHLGGFLLRLFEVPPSYVTSFGHCSSGGMFSLSALARKPTHHDSSFLAPRQVLGRDSFERSSAPREDLGREFSDRFSTHRGLLG